MNAFITQRATKTGKRYVVRYRRGGRAFKVEHAGSFKTMKEAKIRRDLVAGELAAGRDPRDVLVARARVLDKPLRVWAKAYEESRVDLGAETRKNMKSHLKAILPTLGERLPSELTSADVRLWISEQTLEPSSLSRYLSSLRLILDFAGVEPNPARDTRVKVPKVDVPIPTPPTASQVAAIISYVPSRWRLPLRTLEQTGMRIGELEALTWGDVDVVSSRFRIAQGKTRAARRWVAVPEWVMEQIAATCPLEDRMAERKVFPKFAARVARHAMARACKTAGIPHFTPHDLRHRYASVKLREGVPVTELAAQGGWSRKDTLLNVYAHVLLEDE